MSTTIPLTPPSTPPADFSDVFGSRSPSPTTFTSRPSSPSLPPDLTRLRRSHNTNGYRDGITAGKALTLQAGFDEGYTLGARIGLKVGWVMGVLAALAAAAPLDSALAELRRQAERELVVERVFGRDWWDKDGVWTWEAPGDDNDREGDAAVTLDEVVDAWPPWKLWKEQVVAAAQKRGLVVEELSYEGEDEEVVTQRKAMQSST